MAYFSATGTSGGGSVTPETPTLLWENSNPNSAFNGQTITISGLSDYEQIMFEVLNSSSSVYTTQYYQKFVFNNNDKGVLSAYINKGSTDLTNVNILFRGFEISGNNIKFQYGYYPSGSSHVSSGYICIPTKIYGYKKAIIE